MRTKFIAGLICSLFIVVRGSGLSVSTEERRLLEVGDQFFQSENYTAAITEYQRLLLFWPQTAYLPYVYYRMGLAYQRLGEDRLAISFLKRGMMLAPSAELKWRLRFQLAWAFLGSGKYDLAVLEFFKIETGVKDVRLQKAARLFRGLVYVHQHNWIEARKVFTMLQTDHACDEDSIALVTINNRLARLIEKPQVKDPRIAKWLSTFLPGAGQLYSGYLFMAFNALALNGANTYFVWRSLMRQNYLDLGLTVTLLWWRYYHGNRFRAEYLARKANLEYQQSMTQQLYRAIQQLSDCLPEVELELQLEDFVPD